MRVLLDACALYPTVLREILLATAARGAFVPLWSARILEEWRRAAARLGPEGAVIAASEAAAMRARWPEAEVAPAPQIEAAQDLPDAADRHVLAAAISGRAEVLATLNLRDFPPRALPHPLRALSPDDLLMTLWLAARDPVEAAVAEVQATTARISGRDQPLRPLLKRAGLPRLGKALG